MDWSFFTTPTGIAVIAAGGSFAAGILGASISAWTIRATHQQRLAADERFAERKFEFDATLAERKFKYDRDLQDHKRRVELSQAVLADFYRLRDVYSDARSPFVWAAEMEPEEGDSEKVREGDYAPIKRLSREREFIMQFWSREYEFAAMFGADARKPFHIIREVHREIRLAVDMLLELKVRTGDPSERAERNNYYKIAFRNTHLGKDEIAEKLDSAVGFVEAIASSGSVLPQALPETTGAT